jgi:hypothetical protein
MRSSEMRFNLPCMCGVNTRTDTDPDLELPQPPQRGEECEAMASGNDYHKPFTALDLLHVVLEPVFEKNSLIACVRVCCVLLTQHWPQLFSTVSPSNVESLSHCMCCTRLSVCVCVFACAPCVIGTCGTQIRTYTYRMIHTDTDTHIKSLTTHQSGLLIASACLQGPSKLHCPLSVRAYSRA